MFDPEVKPEKAKLVATIDPDPMADKEALVPTCIVAVVLVPEVIPEKAIEVAGTVVVQVKVPEPLSCKNPEVTWEDGQE